MTTKPRRDEDDDIQDYKKPWVGLTDEDIREVLLDFPTDFQEWYDRDFVRYTKAIEAKLKEKNT